MKKLFISYKREQEDEVRSLVRALSNTGNFDVWYDHAIPGGQKWWDAILDAIEAADVVLLMLSREYLTSEPCKREWQYAWTLNKEIIPIQIDSRLSLDALPTEIKELQIRQYEGSTAQFQTLEHDLTQLQSPPLPNPMPKRPLPPAAPPPPTKLFPLWLLAGMLVLVFVVGVGLFLGLNNNNDNGTPTPSEVASASEPPLETQALQGATDESETRELQPLAAAADPGSFALTLIYGGLDSFTVQFTETSDVAPLNLRTTEATNVLIEDFPDLAAAGAVQAGTCLRYIRQGEQPALPRGCEASQTLELEIPGADTFWFNDSTNQYRNVALWQNEELIGFPCNNASGSGRCDYTSAE